MEMIDAAAFDSVAADYDDTFTHTRLGRILRRRVWQLLTPQLRPGMRVLELACGTGEDALWLARQGITVLATDGAPGMVQVTRKKARQAGLLDAIDVRPYPLQELATGLPPWVTGLDGVFSNFGGLNTVGQWRPLARALAGRVQPGGWALLVVMGPICPWEIAWHLLHGQLRRARRRLRQPARAQVGGHTIPVWYPSPGQLTRAFSPWFRPDHLSSLGLWLPPTYLGHLVDRWPLPAAALNRLEEATARYTGGWGDHYVLLLRRTTDRPQSNR